MFQCNTLEHALEHTVDSWGCSCSVVECYNGHGSGGNSVMMMITTCDDVKESGVAATINKNEMLVESSVFYAEILFFDDDDDDDDNNNDNIALTCTGLVVEVPLARCKQDFGKTEYFRISVM
uniref:Uncharacterized protein n=1 Tax=Glossina austeni TaxID=7395 RepID=A0A1A9VUT2_GLOAU